MFKKHFGNVVDVVGVVIGPLIYSLKIICFKLLHPSFDVLYASFHHYRVQLGLFYTKHVHSCFYKCNENWYRFLRNDTIEYIFCFPTPNFQFTFCLTYFITATQPCEKKG